MSFQDREVPCQQAVPASLRGGGLAAVRGRGRQTFSGAAQSHVTHLSEDI